jgi:hypothetical protein
VSSSRSYFPALLSQTYTFPENKVCTPNWAPLIEEKETIYTRWFLVDVTTGYWKGCEVGRAHFRLFADQHGLTGCATDVIVGYEDHYLKRVDATTKGYRALQGFDLTYTVLAHVISSDGSVIGIVTEPEVGRLVQYRDRTLVYQAIAQLQQRHLIFLNPYIGWQSPLIERSQHRLYRGSHQAKGRGRGKALRTVETPVQISRSR